MGASDKTNGLSNPSFEKCDEDFINTDEKKPETVPAARQRDQWGSGLEFLMSCIAMSVGLGNIWRFPFVANQNGGGAFLIPYLVVLLVVGRPMYYMEMAIGQFSSRGNVKAFEKMAPVLKAIGYGQLVALFCVATYYCSIMAVTLFYFFNSFTSNFAWADCKPEWREYEVSRNLTCVSQNQNLTEILTFNISSSELYFKRDVLKEKDDISDGIGDPDWKLAMLLLASWIITCLVTIKGVKSSGKAAYFLALFPYVIMLALLVRSATLEGAADGMYYFIETDWKRIIDADVWYAAVTQCFFSLNVGFGEIIMFSSYNNINHNINRDAFIITTLDTFTSLLSGLTIFGILGNLAHNMGVHPRDVLSSGGGTGIAFISYPDAIAKFEYVPWLFAILFFLMLFILGIGSLAALHGAINTAINDAFQNISRWKISVCTACVLFLVGLIYTTPGGQHVLELVDHFGGTLVVFPFAIIEVTSVVWIYGVDQFCLDLEFMTKRSVSMYWRICWGFVTPGLLIIVFLYFLVTLKPLTYGIYGLEYPAGLNATGWSIFGIGIAQLVLWILYYLYSHRGSNIKQMIQKTFSTKTWSPEDPKIAAEWKLFKEQRLQARGPPTGCWLKRKTNLLLGK